MRLFHFTLLIGLGSLVPGCFVFDPSLYMNADAGADASSPLRGVLADVCGDQAPLLELDTEVRSYTFAVDTQGRSDSTRDVSSCTGRVENGPDLFLAIDAAVGDRWHFHVRVDPAAGGADPAIYVLRNCDVRACTGGDGVDVCGVGSDEHLTFVPESAGRHVVAFDSPDPSGFAGSVEAYRTVCGDGLQEHSENCDDGNDNEGDDCNSRCMGVLSGSSPLEREVNDDIYSANALRLAPGASMSVRGEVTRLCEVDVFAVEVPENGSISAALRAQGGGECPPQAEGIRLELIELLGAGVPHVRVEGVVPEGGVCPALAPGGLSSGLPAGTYYLRVVKVQERPDELRYQLDVSVNAAP